MRVLKVFLPALFLLFFAGNLYAVKCSVGATCWYAWWSPMFEDRMLNIQRYIDKTGQEIADTGNSTDINPSLLGGPVISIGITENLSFGSTFVYGPFYRAKSEYSNIVITDGTTNTIKDSMDIRKYDSDSVLNYRLTDFMHIFSGFKYQGYDYKGKRSQVVHPSVGVDSTYSGEYSVKSNAFGAGAGFGFEVRVIENLFSIINVSGVYMRSEMTARGTQVVDGTPYWFKDKDSLICNVYGININPQLIYPLPFGDLTMVLGARYQYLKYYVADTDVELEYNGFFSPDTESNCEKMMQDDYDGTSDQFWGITFAVIYSFNI
jgi:hypothetical protein